MNSNPDYMQPSGRKPRFRPVIRVFISSTFTDLKNERDALQRRVFPKLERLCASWRFQFHAIDLRWGVPTEASLDHRTMRICFEELRRSQEISPQPNFLVLLGNRYGWRPLPEEIFPDEFERLEQAARSDDERKTLRTWYRRDDNSVLPVHILRSRKQGPTDGQDHTDERVWSRVQRVLWEVINRAYPASLLAGRFDRTAGLDESLPPEVRFQASATEQEIWRGAFGVPDAGKHVLACVREIDNLSDFSQPADIREFVDVDDSGRVDAVSQAAFEELKQALRTRLDKGGVFEFGRIRLAQSSGKQGPGFDVTTEHLDELCERVFAALEVIITRQMDEYWGSADPDAPSPRELELELNEHRRFSLERAPRNFFIGREEQLKAIREYLDGDSRRPLVMHGASGSGKTALLARAAQEAGRKWRPIVRFIGVTPNSSDTRALLASLCRELRQRHPLENPLPEDIGDLARELNRHFHAATVDRPVVLFLDALDQLSDTDPDRSLLWLPTGDLPEHSKLVVSCLSDRTHDDPAGEPYRALRGREFGVPDFIDLHALPEPEALELLFERWLPGIGRKLSNEQARLVRDRLKASACRQPLYLRALFDEVRLWRSYDVTPEPAGDLPELLTALLRRLAEPANHGATVGAALSYIASARRGLTELEVLEILYRDSGYRRFLETRAALTGHRLPDNPKRIPIAFWSRLRFDLAPYLSEIAAPGAIVINFYHRQVVDCVRALFLDSEAEEIRRHEQLADYFEQQESGLRRTDELPWQMAEVRAWPRLYDLLADLEFFEQAWQANEIDLKTYWAQVESGSDLRMNDAYGPVINAPEKVRNKNLICLFDLGKLLSDTGHPEEAFNLLTFLIECFRKTGDWKNYQASLNNQAGILHARGNLDSAMKLYKEAERICRELGNKDGLFRSLNNQASIFFARGDLDDAMKLYKEAERICRELGNKETLQALLNNQAGIHKVRGNLDGAMKLFKEAERICRELGNKEGLSRSLNNQAGILYALDDLDGAMKLFKEHERICRELGRKDGLSSSLNNQAGILYALDDLDGAMKLNKEAERICRELGSKVGLQNSLNNQANISFARGDLDDAMKLYKEAERICRELGNKETLQVLLINQAGILYALDDLDGAMKLNKEAERICRELGNPEGLATSLLNQVLLMSDKWHRLEDVLPLAEEAYRLASEHGHAALAHRIKEILDHLKRQTSQRCPSPKPRPAKKKMMQRLVWWPQLLAITWSLLLAGGGYSLTLISPWLWLVGGPLLFLAVLLLSSVFTIRYYRCPECGRLKWLTTKNERPTCLRCGG